MIITIPNPQFHTEQPVWILPAAPGGNTRKINEAGTIVSIHLTLFLQKDRVGFLNGYVVSVQFPDGELLEYPETQLEAI